MDLLQLIEYCYTFYALIMILQMSGPPQAATSETTQSGTQQSVMPYRQKRYLIAPYSVPNVENMTWEQFVASKKSNTITLDTETTGLHRRKDRVIMVQIGFIGLYSVAIDSRYTTAEQWAYLDELFSTRELIIAANIGFDYNMLKNHRVLLRPKFVYDVLDVDYMLNLGLWQDNAKQKPSQKFFIKHGFGRFSLAGLSKVHLDYTMPKGIRLNFQYKRDEPFTEDEIQYGLDDIDILFPLYKILRMEAFKKGFTKTYKLHNKVFDDQTACSEYALCSADMEYAGIDISEEVWLNNLPYFIAEANRLLDAMYDQLIADEVTPPATLFSKRIAINWGSPAQVVSFFKRYYGVTLTDKFGKEAASKGVLEQLDMPIAKLLIAYRQSVKNITTYGKKFIQEHVEDGRLYTSYTRMVSTYRVSAKKPNMQNIPRLKSFRDAFVTRDPDYWHKTADYPQQEPHITGHKTNSKQIRDLYLTGHGDMHVLIANNILTVIRGHKVEIPPKEKDPEGFKKHPDKEFRQIGKMIGLRMNYGGGPRGLADMFKIPIEDAEKFQKAYFEAFPEIAESFKSLKAYALRKGYIKLSELSDIRRYFLEYDNYVKLKNKKKRTSLDNRVLSALQASIERQAINTPTQGEAALMTKAAAIIERLLLIERGHLPFMDAKIAAILAVHDEKVQRVHKDYLDDDSLKYSMEAAALMYCSSIPMKVDAVVLREWAH